MVKSDEVSNTEIVKRKRGRPRKNPLPAETFAAPAISRRKRSLLTKLMLIVFLLALLGVVGFGGWKYLEQQKELSQLKDPQKASQAATEEMLQKVATIVVLPKDEQPVVIEVRDLASVADQAFYNEAEIGDKVLLYSTAKKAVLYRPSTNQIVNISTNIVIQRPDEQGQTPTP